jgi:hypothetical protein
MRTSILRALAAVLPVLAVSACDRPEHAADAEEAASQFVHADTLGSWDAARGLLAQCDLGDASAPLRVTTAVNVKGARAIEGSDALAVTVLYHVAGIASAGEANENGVVVWQFQPGMKVDTVTMSIAPDASGRWRIACGPLPVHRVPSQLNYQMNQMDDASRHAFIEATTMH